MGVLEHQAAYTIRCSDWGASLGILPVRQRSLLQQEPTVALGSLMPQENSSEQIMQSTIMPKLGMLLVQDRWVINMDLKLALEI